MMRTTLRPSSLGTMRARIRDRWTTLADEDIARAGGSLDKLIEIIHAGTGEPRAAIKRDLRRLLVA